VDPQLRRLEVEGRELGATLRRFASEEGVAFELSGIGRERAFRARLVVRHGTVPARTEPETIRWLQLGYWSPRLELRVTPVETSSEGADLDALWSEAVRRCAEMEGPLGRLGGPMSVLVADLDRLTQQLDTWPPEVSPILRLVDGVRPVLSVAARAEFAPNVVVRILARLVDSGVLMIGSREPEAREVVVSPEPLEDDQ